MSYEYAYIFCYILLQLHNTFKIFLGEGICMIVSVVIGQSRSIKIHLDHGDHYDLDGKVLCT